MDKAIISIAYKWNGYGMALFVLITTLIAGTIAGIIGFEREMKGQAAGLRTHVLIAVGSSLLMTISIFAIGIALGKIDLTKDHVDIEKQTENMKNIYDASRIAAGIIAGIGFLGAGTIIRNGSSIRGLTTAATLWICTAIGMACGAGFILEAIVGGFVTMFFLVGLVFIEKQMDKHSPQVRLVVAKNVPILKEIHDQADTNQLVIKNIVSDTIHTSEGNECVDIKISFAFKSDLGAINDFCESFANNSFVYQVKSTKYDKRS